MSDLRKIDVELENLRRINKDQFFIRANIYQESANRNEEGLRNLFFTIAIGVITLAVPLFFNKPDLFVNLSVCQRSLISLALITHFISILFGAADAISTINFFLKMADVNNNGERIWSKHAFPDYDKYTNMLKEGDKLKDNVAQHSTTVFLILQGTSVIAGTLALLLATITTLN